MKMLATLHASKALAQTRDRQEAVMPHHQHSENTAQVVNEDQPHRARTEGAAGVRWMAPQVCFRAQNATQRPAHHEHGCAFLECSC